MVTSLPLGGREPVRAFKVPNRAQGLLLTQVSLDSIAPVGSALRCLDELVEKLDTREIEGHYDLDSPQGQNPFHPKTLLKVALFALHTGRFSLRKMEEDTDKHLGYKWLTGDERVDHSTMGYFLSRFRTQIVALFAQVVRLCVEEELVDFEVLAIDSVKLRANASYRQSRDQAGLDKESAKLQARLEQLLAGVDGGAAELEAAERRRLEKRIAKLEQAKQTLQQRLQAQQPNAHGTEQRINLTDGDARIMVQANGERNAAYSVSTTTDAKRDIITHFQVNEADDDTRALLGGIEGSRLGSGRPHGVVVADAGFGSLANLEALEAGGQQALIPDRRLKGEARETGCKGAYDRSKFVYCPADDTYRCPAGATLAKVGEGRQRGRPHGRYANRRACHRCTSRTACTKGRFREVWRDQAEGLREQMRLALSDAEGKRTYGRRAHAAESPYGHAKRNLRFTSLLRRGVEKVRMEVALLFMLHNLLRLGALPAG